jgi:hypothetical protein
VTTELTCDRHQYEPVVAHRPNVDQMDRDVLEDLGVIDDDRVEDLPIVAVAGKDGAA